MSAINFLSRFTFIFLLVGIIASCGLKYVPGPSLEDLAQSRKEKLEEQLSKDFAAVNKK